MAWDSEKPETSGYLISAQIRQNWVALEKTLGGMNLLADPTFLIWSAGDALAPDHWRLSGAGAGVSRAGLGLADATRRVGRFCARVAAGGAEEAVLRQHLLPPAAWDNFMEGLAVSVGCWVLCPSTNTARIAIDDGTGRSNSAFHPGGGVWRWLTVSRMVGPGATQLAVSGRLTPTGSAYFSGWTFLIGEVPPANFQPAPVGTGSVVQIAAGSLVAVSALNGMRWSPRRPTLVLETRLRCGGASAGLPIVVDVNKNGASMYLSRPQVNAGALTGAAIPDGTYASRCLGRGDALSIDVDQVGTFAPGADLTVVVDALQYARPLESFLGVADVN